MSKGKRYTEELMGKRAVHSRSDDSVKIAKLEAELKRVTEERDILKKAAEDSSNPE